MQQVKKVSPQKAEFPEFSLSRLLKTVFNPQKGEKLCILIDLEDPSEVKDFAFLKNKKYPVQKKAYEVLYQGLKAGVQKELNLGAIDFFAYKMTGGSNLELPETVTAPDGKTVKLDPDICAKYDIIMCVGNY